jgi:hypothetical protein
MHFEWAGASGEPNNKRKSNDKMSIFTKHVETPKRFTEEDLGNAVRDALRQAREAGIHSVVCQRIIHAIADAEAVRRATMEAVI